MAARSRRTAEAKAEELLADRKLATNVIVTDALGGSVTYRAGTRPPASVAEKITNPDCWVALDEPAVEEVPVVTGQATQTPATTPTTSAPPPGGEGATEAGGGADTPAAEPARNASTETWAAYATALGQEVPEGAGREDIVALLTAAGLIKE